MDVKLLALTFSVSISKSFIVSECIFGLHILIVGHPASIVLEKSLRVDDKGREREKNGVECRAKRVQSLKTEQRIFPWGSYLEAANLVPWSSLIQLILCLAW